MTPLGQRSTEVPLIELHAQREAEALRKQLESVRQDLESAHKDLKKAQDDKVHFQHLNQRLSDALSNAQQDLATERAKVQSLAKEQADLKALSTEAAVVKESLANTIDANTQLQLALQNQVEEREKDNLLFAQALHANSVFEFELIKHCATISKLKKDLIDQKDLTEEVTVFAARILSIRLRSATKPNISLKRFWRKSGNWWRK